MRHIISSLIAVLMGLAAFGSDYRPLPAALDGSMTLYDFSAVEPSAVPDSLTPFYINYIARHGARYLTSEDKILAVEKQLKEARSRGTLTPAGVRYMALMDSVRTLTAGRWGMLSPIGEEEEWRLGEEMARMYPMVFRATGASLNSVASYVPRVIATMDRFTLAIADAIPGIATNNRSGRSFDMLTRFFVADSLDNAWREHGEWREVYDDFVSRHLSVGPAERLVGKNSGMSAKELRRLTYDMYKVMQGFRAMGMPAPTDEWMSPEEYMVCWEATNLEKYFRYSLSPLSVAPAVGARQVLLGLLQIQTLLEQGEIALPGLSGIFGHAETLLPVFALLGVPGTTALPLDYDQLSEEWSDAVLTPLAANLEIIYSKSASGNLYASMRLNGRNVSPVNDPKRLTVPLTELREYWQNRLSQLL